MADLKKQAENLGIEIDGRWGDERIQQEIDKVNAAQEAEASAEDQRKAKEEAEAAERKAEEQAKKAAEKPVKAGDLEEANGDTLPTLGGPRVASSQEIREENAGVDLEVSPYPADPLEAHAYAVALSKDRGPAPEFRRRDIVRDDGTALYPVRLLNDWWDGQGIRHKRGETVDLPYNEALRLVGEQKAERADAFTPDRG